MSIFGYSMPGYFQNMPGIGASAVAPNTENESELKKIEQELQSEIDAILAPGSSDNSIDGAGQKTASQLLGLLVDQGSWCPVNSLLGSMNNAEGSTGLITGLGKISDKWAVIVAADNINVAGTATGSRAIKLTRATEMAKQLHIPLVYLLNSCGAKPDVPETSYTGRINSGTPFYRNADLMQHGVPVIVGIYGKNTEDGGYNAVSPTVLLAHEKASMAVGSADSAAGAGIKGPFDKKSAQALIDTVKNSKPADQPGAVSVHYNETGFFREVYSEKEGVIEAIKKYMDAIPAYNENFFRVADPAEPVFPSEDLYTHIPFNQRRAYDIRKVLACLVDNSEFSEFKANYGPEIICGLAKVNGLLCGVAANLLSAIQNYPEYRDAGSVGAGGMLYRQGLIKMNEFITLCARDRIPVIWIQDTLGIDIDDSAERAELLALGQTLIFSIQNAKIPQMEITLRKGTAAAHYVMGGPQGNDTNVFSIGTAATEIYCMNGETAAAAAYTRQLVSDHDAGKDIQPVIDKMNELIKSYTEKSRPIVCARQALVDEIVKLSELRKYICAFIGAAYQNPAAICAFHQMLIPRLIREWDYLQN